MFCGYISEILKFFKNSYNICVIINKYLTSNYIFMCHIFSVLSHILLVFCKCLSSFSRQRIIQKQNVFAALQCWSNTCCCIEVLDLRHVEYRTWICKMTKMLFSRQTVCKRWEKHIYTMKNFSSTWILPGSERVAKDIEKHVQCAQHLEATDHAQRSLVKVMTIGRGIKKISVKDKAKKNNPSLTSLICLL